MKLFGAWTTLPAGPATLAAKSGALIALARDPPPPGRPLRDRAARRVHRAVVRRPPTSSGRRSGSPTPSRRRSAAAPEQWYSFKPMWPDDPAEGRALEARAIASGGPRGAIRPATVPPPRSRPVTEASAAGPRPRLRGSLIMRRRVARVAAPRAPAGRRRRVRRRALVPPGAREPRPGAREPRTRLRGPRRERARDARGATGGHRPRRPRAPGPRLVPARGPLLPRGRPGRRLRHRRPPLARLDIDTPDEVREAPDGGRPRDHRRHALRGDRAADRPVSTLVGHGVTAPMESVDDPALQRWFVQLPQPRRRRRRAHRGFPTGPAARAAPRRVGRPGRRSRPHRHRDRGPVLRTPGADPGRPGAALAGDRRPDLRRVRAPGPRRPLPVPPVPRAGPRDGDAPRADRRPHGGDRGRLRVDDRRRARAVVGRVPPDLAGPRPAGRQAEQAAPESAS